MGVPVLPFGRAGPGVMLRPRRGRPSRGHTPFGRIALRRRVGALLRVLRLRGQRLVRGVRARPRLGGLGVLRQKLLPRKARASLGASPRVVHAPGGRLRGGGRHVPVHSGGGKWLFVFCLDLLPTDTCATPRVRRWLRIPPRGNSGGRGGRRGAGEL